MIVETGAEQRLRDDALDAWRAGLEAVNPCRAVSEVLSADHALLADPTSTLVVATGKAAVGMAAAAATASAGYVLVPHGTPTDGVPAHFVVAYGGHPVPDAAGLAASRTILDAVQRLTVTDTLLYLVSGGSSALFEVPVASVPDDDLVEAYRQLLFSGASIEEINIVRRALSAVKGGGLSRAAHPAGVVTLALSDVIGDDPATIGSGPTVCATDPEPAAGILRRYRLDATMPSTVIDHQQRPAEGQVAPAGDGRYRVVASSSTAVRAARAVLEDRGYQTVVPEKVDLCGDAHIEACRLADLIRSSIGRRPKAIVLGGETTVRVEGDAGRGGRCQHLAASLATLLEGAQGFACVVAGTDGADGNSDAAGAIVSESTASRALRLGLNPADAVARFDTAALFDALEDQVVTGPTGTNVADLFVAVVCALRETAQGSC